VNLASSTLVAEGQAPADGVGIIISYSLRVKLNCGTLGGELVTDVPFKLLHPAPGNCSPRYRDDKAFRDSITLNDLLCRDYATRFEVFMELNVHILYVVHNGSGAHFPSGKVAGA
jgi:hypothetical protein